MRSEFRYKLDTNGKILKVLIYKDKLVFLWVYLFFYEFKF